MNSCRETKYPLCFLTKLKTNLWKCYNVRKRHYILTTFIILLPVVLFALIGYARASLGELQKETISLPQYNPIWLEDTLFEQFKLDIESSVVLYSPANNFTNTLMREVQLKLHLLNHGILEFNSERELLRYYDNLPPTTCFAVIFNGLQNDSIPTTLDYDIRYNDNVVQWKTNQLFNRKSGRYIIGTGPDKYFQSGLILLQMAIDRNYISMQLQNNITMALQAFPQPPHTEGATVTDMIMSVIPLATLFSFVIISIATLTNIVEEKDSGIKELMKMMGLPTFVMWIGWFIEAFVLNTFSIVLIVLCMKIDFGANAAAIEFCNPFVYGIFLSLYCSASTTLCFVISTILNTPNFTSIIGFLIWGTTYLIPYLADKYMKVIPIEAQLILCIFPNFAMYYGYEAIFACENRNVGLQWNNLSLPASGGVNEITMLQVWIMLVVEMLVFTLLTIYVDSVKPGKLGVGKPWRFPLDIFKKSTIPYCNITEDEVSKLSSKIEDCSLTPGVRLRCLTKKYDDVVVNNLYMNFYKGEITSLLGHNGAGKTTLLSIISGMVEATSGFVMIDNRNLVNNLDYIRSIVGVCPQNNLLCRDLNVEEHLQFVAMLNNIESSKKKINKMLEDLKLDEHRFSYPDNLSGGMKRKLCLGLALIKEPQVLILDEPTSGLDTKSRREIWNILNKQRGDIDSVVSNCTIIISTHYMDEAEHLGDRIAIIDHGSLIAYGTSQYLKSKYATGTNLSIVKEMFTKTDRDCISIDIENRETTGSNPVSNQITLEEYNNLNEEIDGIIKETLCVETLVKTIKKQMITYRLSKDNETLLELVKKLENRKEELYIADIMVSNTSLDDVLDSASKQAKDEVPVQANTTSGVGNRKQHVIISDVISGWILFKSHWQFFRKTWLIYLINLVFNVALSTICVVLTTPGYMHDATNSSKLSISLKQYGNTYVYCNASMNPVSLEMLDQFTNITENQLGEVIVVDSVSEALINLGITNIEKFKQHTIVAAEFNSTENGHIVNAMFSSVALHGTPIAWNLIANTIVKTFLGSSYSIKTSNTPLPKIGLESPDCQFKSDYNIAFLWMAILPIGVTFFMSTFIIYPLRQRNSQMVQLLRMTGVKSFVYWAELFVFDVLLYIVGTAVIVGVIALQTNPIFTEHNILPLLNILILYGIMAIPTVYLYSFNKSISAAISYLQLHVIAAMFLNIMTILIELSNDDTYECVSSLLHIICYLMPHNLFPYILFKFFRKSTWNYNWSLLTEDERLVKCKFEDNPCCSQSNSAECITFKSYSISNLMSLKTHTIIIIFAALFILYSIILFVLSNSHSLSRLLCILRTDNPKCSNDGKRNFFSACNLKKCYKNKIAVQGLNFNVEKGTCLGLLGVNGSGKTTTFKMLTGNLDPDNGDAFIEGTNLQKTTQQYLSKIGYCPQVDVIIETLTVRQMLTLFANIKGYGNVDTFVDVIIYLFDLTNYSDILCRQCSGGTKRKLSLGISLIVNPEVMMLDEPTCGVDPISRRYLWNVLSQLKKEKAMILTSHSMVECEILCDSVSILDQGQVIISERSVATLKQEHGNIYTVQIKVSNQDNVDSVADKFLCDFKEENAHLQTVHIMLLKFGVKREGFLANLLRKLEVFKKECDQVEDYDVSMPNLEEIFLSILEV